MNANHNVIWSFLSFLCFCEKQGKPLSPDFFIFAHLRVFPWLMRSHWHQSLAPLILLQLAYLEGGM